jgi:hypothetical protein
VATAIGPAEATTVNGDVVVKSVNGAVTLGALDAPGRIVSQAAP